jgi:hypothetical protein
MGQVWEYLDQAYMRQDTFLRDLMKPVHAFKELGEKKYRGSGGVPGPAVADL